MRPTMEVEIEDVETEAPRGTEDYDTPGNLTDEEKEALAGELRKSEDTFKRIDSATIQAVFYDRKKGVMLVDFIKGASYLYFGVPNESYESFKEAESAGKYFAQYVKKPFVYFKVTEESAQEKSAKLNEELDAAPE